MQEPDFVSVWSARADGEEQFWVTLAVGFSDDGDALCEAELFDAPLEELQQVFADFTGVSSLARGLEALGAAPPLGDNALVLLYDYRHAGAAELDVNGGRYRFLGSVRSA